MRYTLIELGYAAAGLVAALAITWAAAWAYPLGRQVIWWVGGVAMAAVVAINWPTVSNAIARDKAPKP